MSSDKLTRRIQDILDNIHWIQADIDDMDWQDFYRNRLVQDAVLFSLLRLSEAARKLGDEAEDLMPEQPWHQIQSFGNILRHDYDTIDLEFVWSLTQGPLESLEASCQKALEQLDT